MDGHPHHKRGFSIENTPHVRHAPSHNSSVEAMVNAAASVGRRRRIRGGPLLLRALSLVLLLGAVCLRQAEAGAYNPPLGEDARLDQVEDYPGAFHACRALSRKWISGFGSG